ncbi:hypothetical protein [Nitrosomonas sp.]|uniref:hypothetical protein n=1 Tax=Nitrosomonas sp. TaxID=42353 RepID=UPI0025D4DFC9|nr:hypothetical protein [Nitrosomonas sp.]
MSIRIFGIEIEVDKKANILTIAVFLVSLIPIAGSFFVEIFSHFHEPEIVLDNIGTISLYSATSANGEEYLRLATPFTYIYKGNSEYNDFIKPEQVTVFLDNKEITLLSAKNRIEIRSEGKKLIIDNKGDASPVALKAGTVHKHETEFIPFHRVGKDKFANFIAIEDFIKLLVLSSKLRLDFLVETYEGKTIFKQCFIDSPMAVMGLRDEKRVIEYKQGNENYKGWAALSCG